MLCLFPGAVKQHVACAAVHAHGLLVNTARQAQRCCRLPLHPHCLDSYHVDADLAWQYSTVDQWQLAGLGQTAILCRCECHVRTGGITTPHPVPNRVAGHTEHAVSGHALHRRGQLGEDALVQIHL